MLDLPILTTATVSRLCHIISFEIVLKVVLSWFISPLLVTIFMMVEILSLLVGFSLLNGNDADRIIRPIISSL